MSDEESPGLKHVFWIGGSPCAGKSTIATSLARRHAFATYHCDDHFQEHGRRVSASSEAFARILSRSTGDRLRQPIDIQVADELFAYRDEFPLILSDIAVKQGRLIVEAAALLPELLSNLGVPADRAVWLIPTETFQRNHYAERTWAWNLLESTSDPVELFDRWMKRDAMFAGVIAKQATDCDYQVITVDGSRSIEDIEREVSRLFGL